jgi:holo-[acyl-carrier protein] synthase
MEGYRMKGIGVDQVSVQRIAQGLHHFGEKFVDKILSDKEKVLYQILLDEQKKVAFLAKRFCMKEALVKALGTGFQQGVSWQDFSILPNDLGKPEVYCQGKALERVQALGASLFQISVSDEGDHCIAFAVLE